MNVAFVQNAQHDVDGDERGQNQEWFIRERILESRGGALERALNAGRHVQILLDFVDGVDRVAQRGVRSEVERQVTTGNWPW